MKLKTLIKSLIFNFIYFDFGTAVKLPVIIYGNVKFTRLKGKVELTGPIRRGQYRFGGNDNRNLGSSLSIDENSTLVLKGGCFISSGFDLHIEFGGVLEIGLNLFANNNCTFLCCKHIQIGDEGLWGFGVTVMDRDGHGMYNADDPCKVVTNLPAAVKIGRHVWLSAHTNVLKGVSIAEDCIIAAGGIVTQSFANPNTVIGGCNKVLKENVNWEI